jgi:hypothetical protein
MAHVLLEYAVDAVAATGLMRERGDRSVRAYNAQPTSAGFGLSMILTASALPDRIKGICGFWFRTGPGATAVPESPQTPAVRALQKARTGGNEKPS